MILYEDVKPIAHVQFKDAFCLKTKDAVKMLKFHLTRACKPMTRQFLWIDSKKF